MAFFVKRQVRTKILICLSPEDVAKLKKLAERDGTKKAILIRTIVREYLRNQDI